MFDTGLRESQWIHVSADGTIKRIVIALVEDDAFNGEPCDGRDHPAITIAREVVIA